jgi:NADH-quinone oxidoreductase subunit L
MSLSDVAAINPIYQLVPWIILIPAIGLLINMLLGNVLSEFFVGLVACLASASTFVISVLMAIALANDPQAVRVHLMDWISVGNLNVDWNFRVDTLSVLMMLVVSGVGTLIHIYATGYMHHDVRHQGDPRRYTRFFVFFNLFIMAMMVLVSADNYLMLFVGWEGVGLCSYLLIGFWFEKGERGLGNAKAAKKAFIVNRVGDFGLLIALFFIFWFFNSFDYDIILQNAADADPRVLTAITLFMLLGVTGKSAQLPLHVWLPDAMAGPTPVSALIHAATMVTAGVYLIARSAALYTSVPQVQSIVVWIGAATALFGATIAVGQNDIKKVLAYSTISQLGFMIVAVGIGAFSAGMFHLVTHAFFKALLFLAAGSVILGIKNGSANEHHAESEHSDTIDAQDMRNMGGLRKQMRVTFWVYLIGGLSLAGIPPLAGFFSKDEILSAAGSWSTFLLGVLLAATFLTAFYIGRQLVLVFFGTPRSKDASQAKESPLIITFPLIILAILSIVGGMLNLPGIHTLDHWLESSIPQNLSVEFMLPIALVSLLIILIGLFLAWTLYGRKSELTSASADPLSGMLGSLYGGLKQAWWVDELYHAVFVRPYQMLTRFLAQTIDLAILDGITNGLAQLIGKSARFFSRLQNGYVRTYLLTIFVGLTLIVTYLVFQ